MIISLAIGIILLLGSLAAGFLYWCILRVGGQGDEWEIDDERKSSYDR